MLSIIKPGQVVPDVLHHDEALTDPKIRVGTYAGQDHIRRDAPRAWSNGGSQLDQYYLLGQPMWLSGTEVEIGYDSAEVFRWRLRDTARGAAERSGVSQRYVLDMCTAFGAGAPLLYVGGLVSSVEDMKHLPDGSVLYNGHPDQPKFLSVYEWAEGELHHLLGPEGRPQGVPMTIHTMPGMEDAKPDMTPADDITLSRIALRAWRVGKTYKNRHGWCGVFENCLAALGINHDTVSAAGTTQGPGDELRDEQITRMPEGTLLWHSFRGGDGMAVYIRDDSARNMLKTRRLWGYNDNERNSNEIMTILSTPEEPMVGFNVAGVALRTMPEGTVYHRVGYDAIRTRGQDHQFGIEAWATYAITHFPIEENAA